MSSGLDGDDALTDTRQLAVAIGIIEHAEDCMETKNEFG